jgi:hypothetical protein
VSAPESDRYSAGLPWWIKRFRELVAYSRFWRLILVGPVICEGQQAGKLADDLTKVPLATLIRAFLSATRACWTQSSDIEETHRRIATILR